MVKRCRYCRTTLEKKKDREIGFCCQEHEDQWVVEKAGWE